jgi:hypothetical protein
MTSSRYVARAILNLYKSEEKLLAAGEMLDSDWFTLASHPLLLAPHRTPQLSLWLLHPPYLQLSRPKTQTSGGLKTPEQLVNGPKNTVLVGFIQSISATPSNTGSTESFASLETVRIPQCG